MRTRLGSIVISLCVVLAVATAGLAQEPAVAGGDLSQGEPSLTSDQVTEIRDKARSDLATVPADAAPETTDARRRTALDRRIALAEEFLALIATEEALAAESTGAAERLRKATEALATVQAGEPAKEPLTPTKADFDTLKEQVSTQRERVSALKKSSSERVMLVEQASAKVAEARTRRSAAETQAQELSARITAATDEAERTVLELRLSNTALETALTKRREDYLARYVAAERELEPVRVAEVALAEARLARMETEFGIYGKTMERILAEEQRQLEENLAERQRQAGEAATPVEQFEARWESEIAQALKNVSELNTSLLALSGEVDEQEKRLLTEKEELDGLRELVQRSGTSGRTAERIKQIHQRIPTRTRLLELSSHSKLVESLGDLRSRRFEIEDLLLTLNERLDAQTEEVLADLDEPARATFIPKSADMGSRCRAALREEKGLLTDVISQGTALQRLHQERFRLLDELERFVRSKAFRIRDGELLGWPVVQRVDAEIRAVLAWAGRCFSSTSMGGMREMARSPATILYGLLLFPLLPVILFLLRQRIRRFVKNRNQRTIDVGRRFWDRPVAIGGGLISAALLPIYLFLAGRICGAANIHPELDPVLARILASTSILLFIWLIGRSFFAGRGTAQVQLHLHPDASHALYRSLRLALISAAFFLLPWDLLRRPPFALEALPRITYTLFTIGAGVAIFLLLRPSSPFVKLFLARNPRGRLRRTWPALVFVITVLMLVIVGFDVAGFRYGSLQLARSFLLSLLVLFLAPPLYSWLLDVIRALTRRRQKSASTAAPGEEDRPEEGSAERLVGFVRTLLVIGVALLLASFWGIDEQAFRTLDEMRLNSVDAEQAVTVADVLVFMVLIVSTIWFLRVLPGIFEFLVFSRINVDSGVRYAILTISQYALFTVGMLMALSTISLDLSRLGWLLAAMGVGLGFGLQEIVSNFVSGIILLLERPIRVGDVVTIAGVSGSVRRINIRATTLLNFDRQEVIIPNRKLITGDVTNWTGSDTINRLVIQIGVAYGSDVDLVTRTLEGVIRDQPEVLRDPAPSVLFMKHGESSLDFEVRVFIPDPSVKMGVMDRMNKAINRSLAEQAIEIPFPQRDLHVRSSTPSVTFEGTGDDSRKDAETAEKG